MSTMWSEFSAQPQGAQERCEKKAGRVYVDSLNFLRQVTKEVSSLCVLALCVGDWL